jgi:hypothetical protein
VKSKGTAPKFDTEVIQLATKLFPKNHRLRSTQTLGKSNRDQELKRGKLKNTVRTKITDKIEESRRTTGGFGPPFPYQISAENYTMKDSVHRESQKRKTTGGPTREMERGRERWQRGLGRWEVLRFIYHAYYIFFKCL